MQYVCICILYIYILYNYIIIIIIIMHLYYIYMQTQPCNLIVTQCHKVHTPIDKMSFWGKSVLTHIHTYYIWCRFVHKTRGARVIVIYCGVRCVNCARLAALYNYYIIGAHSCCAHLTSTANYVIITPSNPNRSRLHSLLDKCYKVCNNYTIESQQEPTP